MARAMSLLRALETAAVVHGAPIPRGPLPGAHWQGMTCLLDGTELVVPLEEIAEVIAVPRVTRIPRAPAWLRGIANVRGRLVPIIDLRDLLGVAAREPGSRWRVLVAVQSDRIAGFVVDAILGMVAVSEDAPALDSETASAPLVPLVRRAVAVQGRVVHEFGLRDMLIHPGLAVVQTPDQWTIGARPAPPERRAEANQPDEPA